MKTPRSTSARTAIRRRWRSEKRTTRKNLSLSGCPGASWTPCRRPTAISTSTRSSRSSGTPSAAISWRSTPRTLTSGSGSTERGARPLSVVFERVAAHLGDDFVQPVLARAEAEAHLPVLTDDVLHLHGELRRHDAVEVHDDDALLGIEKRAPLGLVFDDFRDDPVRDRHPPEDPEVDDLEPEEAVLEAQRLDVAAERHGNPLLDADRQAEAAVLGLDEDLPHLGHVPRGLSGDRVQRHGVDGDDETFPSDREGRQVGGGDGIGGIGHGPRILRLRAAFTKGTRPRSRAAPA